jgi:hypothetical protein
VVLSATSPAAAAEKHFPYTGGVDRVVDAEGNCYKCHTLDPLEGTPGTNYIQRSARTMVTILQKGAAPDHLGCTFCHYSITSTVMMKEVYSHFSPGSQLSMHSVGRRFDNGAETDGELFSTIDLDAANDAYQLDCVDCHDPALLAPDIGSGYYIGHQDKTARVNNLKMLRGGVNAAGAYDDLCRLCHGAGMMKPVASHADGSNLNPIVEDDGTRCRRRRRSTRRTTRRSARSATTRTTRGT